MLPKTGNKLPGNQTLPVGSEYPLAIAFALKEDVGDTRQAIKTLTRWTGASERTVQNWLSAVRGPSGAHLVALAKHSTAVHFAYLALCGRSDAQSRDVGASVALLHEAIALLVGSH
ncbi:hypothetical protein [Paraburkholderia sp. BL17N1]|uniref:hypothetical protein n=1 Tax=Paraburkholderia sp. BL17N1 TaxID=1938798 RepID=UPI000EAD1D40|nr:hypothetical protein [Paraburkholderia sp. BL17N1]RKR45964.1 hypothetical protein B0G82_3633 [Paraburkholderia sp. BL17N1]